MRHLITNLVRFWLMGTCLLACHTAQALPDSLRVLLATRIAEKLDKQIQRNKENDLRGLAYLNQYVLVVDDDIDFILGMSGEGRFAVLRNQGADKLTMTEASELNNQLKDLGQYFRPKNGETPLEGLTPLQAYLVVINYLPVEFADAIDVNKLTFNEVVDRPMKERLTKTARQEFRSIVGDILKKIHDKSPSTAGVVSFLGNAYAVTHTGADVKGGRRWLVRTEKLTEDSDAVLADYATNYILTSLKAKGGAVHGKERADLVVAGMKNAFMEHYKRQYVFEFRYTLSNQGAYPELSKTTLVHKRETFTGWEPYFEHPTNSPCIIRVYDNMTGTPQRIHTAFELRKKMGTGATDHEYGYALALKQRFLVPYQTGEGYADLHMADAAAAQTALELLRTQYNRPQPILTFLPPNRPNTFTLYEVHREGKLQQPTPIKNPVPPTNNAVGIDFTRAIDGDNRDDFTIKIIHTRGDAFSMLGTLVTALKERAKYTKEYWTDARCSSLDLDIAGDVALMTGIIDGLIDEFFALPELVGAIPQLIQFCEKLADPVFRQVIWEKMKPLEALAKHYKGNDCQINYQIGKDLTTVASCFFGISTLAKARDLARFEQLFFREAVEKIVKEDAEALASLPFQLKKMLDAPINFEPTALSGSPVKWLMKRPDGTQVAVLEQKVGKMVMKEAELTDVPDLAAQKAAGKTSEPIPYEGKAGEPDEVLLLADGRVCGIQGKKCFVAGTLMECLDGYRGIEQIAVGQQVKSFDEHTQQFVWGTVSQLYVRKASALMRVRIGSETFLCTPEHPFYVARHWKRARDLLEGDSIILSTGGYGRVHTNARLDTTALVYNVEVASWHTYCVGRSGVLVHNADYDLEKLEKFLNDYTPKLKSTGLTAQDLDNIAKLIDSHEVCKHVLTINGKIQFTSFLKEVEKLGLSPEALERVVQGLKTSEPSFFLGEAWRLRVCQEIGWDNIKDLELPAGKYAGMGKQERYIDILTKDNLHIETKYYASLLKETNDVPDIANKFLKQIEKDLEILESVGKEYQYMFAKSSIIKDEAELHRQVRLIMEDGKYDNKTIKEKYEHWYDKKGEGASERRILKEAFLEKFKLKDIGN